MSSPTEIKNDDSPMVGPSRPLRLLHTSDVHLETDTYGSGAEGARLREKVRRAFSEVVTIANAREVDLMLIVGDLFDSSRVSEEALAFALGDIARDRLRFDM